MVWLEVAAKSDHSTPSNMIELGDGRLNVNPVKQVLRSGTKIGFKKKMTVYGRQPAAARRSAARIVARNNYTDHKSSDVIVQANARSYLHSKCLYYLAYIGHLISVASTSASA
ncbi:hypothetical protein EVAR_65480_1 [Eumeta japonica]|uniref:Uncharacterized protein n=1 Tax=Eumeta variegata TaxID=151549 RepID=A0A4C2A9I3_EUMVA|nr:hypothetical protein EVAR_65480_1 [Eumeta japonica]